MKIFSDFDLTEYNSYKVKAVCAKAYFPENEEDVVQVFSELNDFILIGSGHNIILSKSYYDIPFIIFNGNYENYTVTDDVIEAESGIRMERISEIALENNLSGVEIFYDIPSSLGGAVVMNAGASGEEIKDVLIKVKYFDLIDKQVKVMNREDMQFQYRNSFFQKNTDKVVLKAWLRLNKSERGVVTDKMDLIKGQRWAKQPRDYPNAGSVFKRPQGYYVGAMMDELALKGYTVGGAKISEKHGGFIVNFNNATGLDILTIIDHVKNKVKQHYGVEIEVEQRVL